MTASRILKCVLYSILLAIILFGCAILLLSLLMTMIFATDEGISTRLIVTELILPAFWLAIISCALYSIYIWCFVLFLPLGATQQEFLRSWVATGYVVVFVVVALMTCYFPLSELAQLKAPSQFWFLPMLLRLG